MRSIGLPELLVILGVAILLLVPTVLLAAVVWFIAKRRGVGPALVCPQCAARVPAGGRYCHMCGRPFGPDLPNSLET